MEAPGIESGVRCALPTGIDGVGVGEGQGAGGARVGSTGVGAVRGADAATLARIALERLERGDLEAVAALLRLMGQGS
jgi:hypothetical protein